MKLGVSTPNTGIKFRLEIRMDTWNISKSHKVELLHTTLYRYTKYLFSSQCKQNIHPIVGLIPLIRLVSDTPKTTCTARWFALLQSV